MKFLFKIERKPAKLYLFISIVSIFLLISCGFIKKGHKKTNILPNKIVMLGLPIIPQDIKNPIIDTPSVVIRYRNVTPEQLKAYFDRSYEINFDRLLSPEFKRINKIVTDQALSLKTLSEYMATTRHRTDSIVHERNMYRELYLQSQKNDLKYQKDALSLASQLVKNQKIDAESQKRQIVQNTIVANVALIGVLIIVGIIYGLYKKVNAIDKKFGHLLKTT